MKSKLLALLLALAVVMSMAVPAAASDSAAAETTDLAAPVTWEALSELEEDADAAADAADDLAEGDVVTLQDLTDFVLLFCGMTEEQLGSYPYDWNCMAQSADLLEGIDYENPSAEATYGDLITMLANAEPLYNALHADQLQPLFIDGEAQPIFPYTSGAVEEGYSNEDSNIIRYMVYVETNYDTDNDGRLDLVQALVQIPRAAMEGDYQAATIYEARPYATGCTDLWGYDESVYNEAGYDISQMYSQPAARVPEGTATTEEAAAAADASSWYYINPYQSQYDDDGTLVSPYYDYEDLTWYDYYLVRGYAVVECGGLGTRGSEGFETCGTDLEIDAFKCVIEWLHGDRVAYTDKTSNIAITADWSNGNVGMTGRSYAGTTQFGLAATGVEGLKTIVPVAGIASWYEYTNSQGISTIGISSYSDMLAGCCAGRKLDPEDWDSISEAYGAYLYQLYQDQEELNGDYGEHWAARDYTLHTDQITCPALIVQGLNDENVRTKEADLMYQAYKAAGADVKLLLHQNGHLTPTNPAGTEICIGDALYDEILNRWFSHYLYNVDNGIEDMAEVTVQDNVDGSWDTYDSWETDDSIVMNAANGASALTADRTTTVTLEGMDRNTWTPEVYTTANTANSASYVMDVTEDLTIEGSVAVSVRVSTEDVGRDALKLSAYLVDVADEEFMCYNLSGNYLPQTVISAAADGEGVWMGGGLADFNLVTYDQTPASCKIIAKGWTDLYNPGSGYQSSEAAERTELAAGVYYDYTIYLQPELYTVQAGHRLVLVIFPDTITAAYDDGPYSFTIDNASVSAEIPVVEGTGFELSFEDVGEDSYCYDAVVWGARYGIVSGFSAVEFGPDSSCTRAQIVTFLWRAAGEPVAQTDSVPFTDADTGAYYYPALLWGYEQGIVAGTTDTTFEPDAPCTRAEAVTFLWRAAGEPAAQTDSVPFTDADTGAYYDPALRWCYERGIVAGTTDTTFEPGTQCTRGMIVTMIYREKA